MNNRRNKSNSAAGFTLIELMIVVAVVAILAAIAVPSYNESVRKTHRAQAKADIVEYAQSAERYFTTNNSFTGFTLPSSSSPRETGATPRYALTLASTASTYTITATPVSGSSQASDRCGTLSINQAGVKTRSTGIPLSDCW
jgi:type IV pilus assembly protein PilE